MPNYYNARYIFSPSLTRYAYFFFSFLHINQISHNAINSEFSVPVEHMDAINAAFDKHNSHVYFFVSAQNSKLIHVRSLAMTNPKGLCEMQERACRDKEMTFPFKVKWLKLVHMPFTLFDIEGILSVQSTLDRPVKLKTLADGEIPEIGWELFMMVWRHPNVLLMMRQSVLEKQRRLA